MFDVHEITDSLPPVRGDEPPSLRQDIADEIRDHLQCGLRRELLIKGDDELLAKQRVLNRFGDPRQIARKLWYQAMWSKIMTQRLVIGSTILSMAVSISFMAMMVLLLQRTDQRQQEQQLINAALMKQVSDLTVQPKESTFRDALLQILVFKVSSDGPPAEGYQVVVDRQHDIGKPYFTSVPAILMTDKTGSADCGFVDPGRYSLAITTPWGEVSESSFILRPGHDHVEKVVVPESRPDSVDVVIKTDGLPSYLKLEHSILLTTFSPVGARDYAGRSWRIEDAKEPWGSIPFLILTPNQGAGSQSTWISAIPQKWWSGNSNWVPNGMKNAKWVPLAQPQAWRVPAGKYSVSFIRVNVTEVLRPDDPEWRSSLDKRGYQEFGGQPHSMNKLEQGPVEFTAEIGKRNEWILKIPDDVIEHLIRGESKVSPLSGGD